MGLADQVKPPHVPDDWRQTIWPAFLAHVLAYLDRGYALLQADVSRTPQWLERHFTWALCRHLEAIDEEQWDYLSPRYDDKHLSDQDFAAGGNPHSAPIIDLVIRYHHRAPEPYFPVEAKVLVTKTAGSFRPKRTVEQYVAEGMKRFIDKKYAAGLPAGAMVGYILAGTPAELAEKINTEIEASGLPCEDRLALSSPEPSTRPRYESSHPRPPATAIRLYHTLIVF